MSYNVELKKVKFNLISPVRIIGALYLIFAASGVATAVGIMFLLQEIDITIERDVL